MSLDMDVSSPARGCVCGGRLRLGSPRGASPRDLSSILVGALLLVSIIPGCGDGGAGSNQNGSNAKNDAIVVTLDINPVDAGEAGTDAAQADAATFDADGQPDGALVAPDAGSGGDVSDSDALDTAADTGGICPGGEGCTCTENSACDNSICIDTADGKVCGITCVENCPKNFSCKKLGASDVTFVCIPDHLTTCSPCTTNADCQHQNADSICLDYGDIGKFCGGPCATDSDCPSADYACINALDEVSGQTKKQCKLKAKNVGGSGASCAKDAECAAGETCSAGACAIMEQQPCACSTWATVAAKPTPCTVSNSFGACTGTRACGVGGLTVCSAATPAEETCDAMDQDCDGITDNLPATVTCSQPAWLDLGSKTACAKDGDCAIEGETCDSSVGLCKQFIGACPGKAVCAGGETVCQDAKVAKVEACNGTDDDCDGATDENFGWINPQTAAISPVGTACGVGPCKGGLVQCASLLEAACTSELKVKKAEACNGLDDDCDGTADDGTCSDGDKCTADVCDGQLGACSNPSTVTCTDANPCTADSCDKNTGKCEFVALKGSCDDGDVCTAGDVCAPAAGGKPACFAGKKQKQCDDTNPCTNDACDKQKGCVYKPNVVVLPCYGGAAGTQGVGTCVGGERFCAAGKLGAVCVGEVVPLSKEVCDEKDDTCNGKTDEGCKASQVTVAFAAAYDVAAAKNKKTLRMELSGESATGRVIGKGKVGVLHLGFIPWLMSLLN